MNYSQKISNTHILDNNLKIKLILLQVLLVTVILILPFYTLSAQPIHSIDVIAGAALNFDSNVTFHQTGEEDITLTGQYITKPFDDPYYLGLRFNFNIAHHIWELQFLHHKVYLTNTTEEVQHFEITHGFNTLTLHHRFVYDEFNLRIGAGVVLPHTESTIRGHKHSSTGGILGWGYHITGPILLAGFNRDWMLGSHFYINTEIQFIAGWAKVPIYDGYASATNFAFHFIFGLGYQL
jgi:hypothetical protein